MLNLHIYDTYLILQHIVLSWKYETFDGMLLFRQMIMVYFVKSAAAAINHQSTSHLRGSNVRALHHDRAPVMPKAVVERQNAL